MKNYPVKCFEMRDRMWELIEGQCFRNMHECAEFLWKHGVKATVVKEGVLVDCGGLIVLVCFAYCIDHIYPDGYQTLV